MSARETASETLRSAANACYRARWAGKATELQLVALARDVLEELGPDRALSTIDRAALVDLRSRLERRGLAPGSVDRRMAALRSILREAELRGALRSLPRFPSAPRPRGRSRVLSEAEVAALEAAMAAQDPQLGALVRFLADTGCRVGEALSLRWECVDFERKRVTFRDTKNGDDRTVPLQAGAMAALHRGCSVGPFFYLTQSRVNHAWARAREVVGLGHDPEVVPHTLRHTLGTRLAASGVSLPLVQRWLGHRDVRSAMRYQHAGVGDLERAMRDLQQGD
jgi:integrase